jgi:FMN phosphatase YigB (HAD superfamily)
MSTRLVDLRSVQAIVTDVDGTLYDQQKLRRRLLGALTRVHLMRPGRAWKTIQCLRVFRRAQEEIRWEPELDISHPQAQYSRTEESTGYSPAFVHDTVARWMEQEPLSYLPGTSPPDVREFFSWAQASGHRLAVLSDYPLEEKLRVLGLLDLFPVKVSAGDTQALRFKPHPALLEYCLRQLRIAPSHALYIGDRPEVDGVIAKRVGVTGVILSHGKAARRGWHDDLLYIQSFTELRSALETASRHS